MTPPSPPCPICSHPGEFVLQEPDRLFGIHPEKKHPLFLCASCGLYFGSPISAEMLGDFYPPVYYTAKKGNRFRSALSRLRVQNRARAVQWRARRGRVLDVGCGRGSLLEELARRGWEVAGTDWNPDNARAVSTRLNATVEGGASAMQAFADSSFDVVSMFHVLEHDDKPLELLSEVHRVLKPGGRLLIAVPNARSAARGLFRRYWCGYDLPRHRCAFTPHSLKLALQRTGYSLERLTGRLTDEALDVHGGVGMLLNTRVVPRPKLQMLLALIAFSLLFPARLLGFYSVMCGYAKKL